MNLTWLLMGVTAGAIASLTTSWSAQAQITPDATLPNNSAVNIEGQIQRITGGTAAGSNLFHSFQEFNLRTGETAYFDNALTINNIITRITGGNLSYIDGLIRANGSANLFLLNPNGIIFGSNAGLNLGGSFLATTATSLKFADGLEFSATHPTISPLLTIHVPIGLQFNPLSANGQGSNGGIIRIQGSGHNFRFSPQTGALERPPTADSLAVQPGKTLALVGREIALEGGNLRAESGTIALWAVTGGFLPIETSTALISFNNEQPGAQLGTIHLSGAASVDSSGAPGGAIQIQSRNLKLEQGAVIASVTEGLQPGNPVTVNASDAVEVLGRRADGLIGSGFLVQTNGAGRGGDLIITTPRLHLRDGAAIATGTDRSGTSGTLRVQATDVELGGLSANGSRLTGFFSNPTTAATGIGGDVIVDARRLSLENGAIISVSTFGAGQSGNILVRAHQVQLQGTSAAGNIGSGFYARTSLNNLITPAPPLTGNAGNVTVIADRLSLQNRAAINVANLGKGNAGNIDIRANTLLLDNQSIITATQRQAEQGNITIQAQHLQLRGKSTITTNASNTIILDTGQAIANNDSSTNGGNININTNTLVALENSDITANAVAGRGGQVIINTQGIFGTQFRNSQTPASDITATSQLGASFSGTVAITTPDVDTSAGLVELSTEIPDATNQMVVGCTEPSSNSFAVTGRGGLPEDPTATIRGQILWQDARDLTRETDWKSAAAPTLSPTNVQGYRPLLEATNWVMNQHGKMELIAGLQNRKTPNFWSQSNQCIAR